ncbi:carotenoid 1,2-hydratase [Microvirga sp. SRT01]|uniref:Carotenoid 1,2-hydratase n=1 Tax=Sphingomonas longa TaxID=2778730 RepID=A0ABS2D317_9SPHN|nr:MULTISPECIES: carotenoid 1,2-hydratase [Alphaproteobacteria]MBM6575318.1 carotenoid 1,2-hydratase [Sphingomonas sp. BT552]MBR7708368.1 carotenoid 1,2-hydratase [Microvirga sp. SRT01]
MRNALSGWLALVAVAAPAAVPYPVVRPGITLAFPADHGAHPGFRTEWWYVTGWLRTAAGEDLGFQVTFFRTRPPVDAANPSRFTARQVVFAHAALSDPATGRLLHGERAARVGFGLARARTGDADIGIRDWRLRRTPDNRWTTQIFANDFALALDFRPTQPPMPQGLAGYSRKGPRPEQASYYYSIPHLRVAGRVRRGDRIVPVTGEAWLDREWSSDYLAPQAEGWDWTGLNFDDGSALMAFRIRRKGGGTLWAGGALRRPDGITTPLGPRDVAFRPLATWRSGATGAVYPVSQEVSIRVDGRIARWRLTPMFAAQELDARRGGLPVYWEGAVRTPGGRGYLELTGYNQALRM